MRQLWRTFRLPALLLVAIFFALLDPIGARYMPQIMEQLMRGTEGITIIMPEMGPADAMASFFGDLAQLGAFILIVIAMGAVAAERERGISAWLLTRPVGRLPYFWSKFAAYSAGILLTVSAGTLLAALYTASLMGTPPPGPTAWGSFFTALYLELILAIALAASALLRGQVAAGGAAFGFMILLWLPQLFLDQTELGKYALPPQLAGDRAVKGERRPGGLSAGAAGGLYHCRRCPGGSLLLLQPRRALKSPFSKGGFRGI